MADGRMRRVIQVWRAERRARRQRGESDMQRTTRDIIGPLGWVNSAAYQELADGMDKYNKSFDNHLPPSLHVSERDRIRHNQAIPLRERIIERPKQEPTS